ncbi:MAG TPA: CbiX/SirB N-terminal domain-containing protein [Casimicrobiaceae bacterium]|nr:CbiX/SirB N-terminal domain-containing protein [Casimicrobiaceae bacterium]
MTSALILFAHGARDERWAEPFRRVLARVEAAGPERAPMLAFLELMTPDLARAIDEQAARGFTKIDIVPLFLGAGGHLSNDLPKIVEAARTRHSTLTIGVATAAGEDPSVIEALADYCVHFRPSANA